MFVEASSTTRRRTNGSTTSTPEAKKTPASNPKGSNYGSIRSVANFSQRRFDIKTLPADMQRVYKLLAKEYGAEYGLLVIFTMRTAVELHRAWHMTLLTTKILNQLKDKFRLRMTWNLGVFRLAFHVEDGGKEVNRKVPYDYDSENQDIYMRIAVALMDGHIDVHEALLYQSETLLGEHTATSGMFLRSFPGRLVLYPCVASTCAVIFFSGDWVDFGIAALCGLASGIVEMCLGLVGGGMMTDLLVGTTTGLIGGLFYRFLEEPVCLSAIFLGTLYWFFYGTAFVIGILEIIAGELEVGVTRFIAVSVKTFVLCLGASFGMLVVGNASEAWVDQADNCSAIFLFTNEDGDEESRWWRIPLYLACSVAVLGQYRFPVVRYWRGLIVMLVGYEVQYEFFLYFASINESDSNLGVATSNVFGAAGSVLSACAVSYYVNQLRFYSDARILRREEDRSCIGKFIRKVMAFGVRFGAAIGLGRSSDLLKLDIEKKLKKARKELEDPTKPMHEIELEPSEQNLIIETIVGSQDMNIWSILMPALYQLVPGSMIAKLWFNYIFPPPLVTQELPVEGSEELFATIGQNRTLTYTTYSIDEAANNVFAGLMIISTSLALGLVFGFALVQVFEKIFSVFSCFNDNLKTTEQMERAKSRRAGMYSNPLTKDDDPGAVALEFREAILHGATTAKEADAIFDAVDWDQSDTIDLDELSDYMLNAGLTELQVNQLFASMDADNSGEVSRAEFRRAILDKANKGLLKPADDEEAPLPKEDDGDVENPNGGAVSTLPGDMEKEEASAHA